MKFSRHHDTFSIILFASTNL